MMNLNVEKLWETENYIPDQIRKTMKIKNGKPTVKTFAKHLKAVNRDISRNRKTAVI